MALIADILLIAGALGAAFYCFVLSRRLTRLTNLEDGVGGAISGLSSQVTDMNRALDRAQAEARASAAALEDSTRRAEAAARKLELMIASLHDLPGNGTDAARGARAAADAAVAAANDAAAAAERSQPAPQKGGSGEPVTPPSFRHRRNLRRSDEAAE